MNKSDFKLIAVIFIISILLIVLMNSNNNKGDYALVYYSNTIVSKIDLNIDKEYTIKGYNGQVVIKVNSGKIGVIKETSPRNLCSKQGFVSNSNEPIVCLPNKIVIKIEKESNEIDTVIR